MIPYKDRTFCESSGTCANTDCPRWINLGKTYSQPLPLADLKDSGRCPGFIENPALVPLKFGMEAKNEH